MECLREFFFFSHCVFFSTNKHTIKKRKTNKKKLNYTAVSFGAFTVWVRNQKYKYAGNCASWRERCTLQTPLFFFILLATFSAVCSTFFFFLICPESTRTVAAEVLLKYVEVEKQVKKGKVKRV